MLEVKTERIYYVEYYYPGMIVSETSSEKVSSLNPSDLEIPKSAYAFCYWSVEAVEINGKWRTFDETKKVEPTTYYIGKVYALAEIIKKFPGKTMLHSNVKQQSDCDRGVQTRLGNWCAFNKCDKLWEVD